MGLFSQDITLGISNPSFVIEKTSVTISKSKIRLFINSGSVVYIDGVKLRHQAQPYNIEASQLGVLKGGKVDIFVFCDKDFDKIPINFFGGQYQVGLVNLPSAKAMYSITGVANIEVMDYVSLAKHYNKSMTKDEIIEDINNNYRVHLTNEVTSVAAKYINSETTDVSLQQALNAISTEVVSGSRKMSTLLVDMGLGLTARGLSLTTNALESADKLLNQVTEAMNQEALRSVGDARTDKEYSRERERIKEDHEFEIEKIKATHTTISEETKNINNNGNGKVVINNNNKDHNEDNHSYCPQCGKKVPEGTKYCPKCGTKLN